MERYSCFDCEFFQETGKPNQGTCRLKPPTVVPNTAHLPGAAAVFPAVNDDDWCAEHPLVKAEIADRNARLGYVM